MVIAVGLGFKFGTSWVGLRVEVCSTEQAAREDAVSRARNNPPIRLKRCLMGYSLLGRGTFQLPYLVLICVWNNDCLAVAFWILEQMY